MRTIKFRAKDIENGGPWRYGSLVNYPDGTCAIVCFDNDGNELSYDVAPDTLGQFIGLRDFDGKEIYEGDILECIVERADNCDNVFRSIVEFDGAAFLLRDKSDSRIRVTIKNILIKEYLSSWLIVGNIHENPELQ